MSLQSLPGLVSESLRWSTIGSVEWPLNVIVLRNLFLAGLFTHRAAVGALRPQMNFLMRLSLGLEIQIHGSVPLGERRKIGEARRTSSNFIGSGRPGAAAKSAWFTRRTSA